MLETNGVPVVSLGTDNFPAFFSPSSGVPSPLRLDTPSEVAAAAKVGVEGAMVSSVALHEHVVSCCTLCFVRTRGSSF